MTQLDTARLQLNSNARKILVIGASGFIGGRLAEKLYLEHGHVSRCLARDYSRLARLCRFPVELVQGDVLRPDLFEAQITDCDVYVFCVHGKDKNLRLSWEVNTRGLENMLNLAAKNHAKHFVFLSTTAIFEDSRSEGDIDEVSTSVCRGRGYAAGKLEGETICARHAAASGLPTTILRPTIVYGPFAPSWTIYPAELARTGVLKDYGAFSGTCNPLFVDDLVDVIVACILDSRAFSETFTVTGAENITWREFFNAYSVAVRGHDMEPSSRVAFWARALPLRIMKGCLKFGASLLPNLARVVYHAIRTDNAERLSWARGTDISTLRLRYYRKQLRFRSTKLQRVLGIRVRHTFEEGMAVTSQWLSHHRFSLRAGQSQ